MNIRLMTIMDYEKVYDLWMSRARMGLNTLTEFCQGIFNPRGIIFHMKYETR